MGVSSGAGTQSLVDLCHHRWAVPLLGEMGRTGGGRFAVLVRRLDVPEESLRRTLAAAMDRGYIVRNPGHGHPLRPDYLLTPLGAAMAPACDRLYAALSELDVVQPGLRKWSMPVVHVLDAQDRAFGELRERLPLVTPRALSLALGTLHEHGLVEHETTHYRLAARARPLPPPLRELALASASVRSGP